MIEDKGNVTTNNEEVNFNTACGLTTSNVLFFFVPYVVDFTQNAYSTFVNKFNFIG